MLHKAKVLSLVLIVVPVGACMNDYGQYRFGRGDAGTGTQGASNATGNGSTQDTNQAGGAPDQALPINTAPNTGGQGTGGATALDEQVTGGSGGSGGG